MPAVAEEKRVDRVRLASALRATADGVRAYILEASVQDLVIAHQAALPGIGSTCELTSEWDAQPLTFICEVEWTEKRANGDRGAVFHSGMVIRRADAASCKALRGCVEWHVMRALEEQKANARGLPVAGAAWSQQSGRGTEYLRHEFSCNRWTAVRTAKSTQPGNGFTVSAQCSAGELMMLREAYERADEALRQVIRVLAQASIEQVNGIPIRRFIP